MSEGKPFTPPNLDKREPTSPINVWCDKCQVPAERHMVYEGGAGDPPLVFEVHCHGDVARIGIEDVEGFYEVMAVYRGRTIFKDDWFHVFQQPDKPTPPASGVEDDPFAL